MPKDQEKFLMNYNTGLFLFYYRITQLSHSHLSDPEH